MFATSNSLPPEFPFPHDTAGWALVFGLVSKELPFLLLIQLNVCRQLPEATRVKTAQLFGQPPWLGWWLTVFPSLYQQIRLPLWAVLAFSFSVIDMALILGPTAPPTFSVLILQWSTDPMLEQQALAAAGSLLQGMVLLILLLCWWVVEQIIRVLPQIPRRMWSLHKIGFLLNQIAKETASVVRVLQRPAPAIVVGRYWARLTENPIAMVSRIKGRNIGN